MPNASECLPFSPSFGPNSLFNLNDLRFVVFHLPFDTFLHHLLSLDSIFQTFLLDHNIFLSLLSLSYQPLGESTKICSK